MYNNGDHFFIFYILLKKKVYKTKKICAKSLGKI